MCISESYIFWNDDTEGSDTQEAIHEARVLGCAT